MKTFKEFIALKEVLVNKPVTPVEKQNAADTLKNAQKIIHNPKAKGVINTAIEKSKEMDLRDPKNIVGAVNAAKEAEK